MTEIDPALARKRRKEIMQSLRAGETEQQANSNAGTTTAIAEATESHLTSLQTEEALPPKKRKVSENSEASESDQQQEQEKLPSNESLQESNIDNQNGSSAPAGSKIVVQNGKKTQIRYDPDVPMSKEQLAAWRREARRVRNRESAAASRQRIRDRIGELEDEVGEWKAKYREAMERLQQVEQIKAAQQQSR
mmetsp:Transcript_18519/g.25673  ORF Transcript_18519/g.25673 Transcript_18519/m.25673 type:complete len:192 (+) Transcript_18519:88-663(+)